MFFSAGNSGPGMNTVGDPSVATSVVSIGLVSESRDDAGSATARIHRSTDNLHAFTSNGPREDGGFKPQIVAPGAAISSTPMWQPGVGLPYALPPGYQLMNGTSMAAPQATGAAALLISAANKLEHSSSPTSSARQCAPRPACSIRAASAFIAKAMAGCRPAQPGICWQRTSAPTRSLLACRSTPCSAQFLAQPGIGVGIYDREGVTDRTVVHAHVYDHAHQGRRAAEELCRELGWQRRHVQLSRHRSLCR